MSLLSRNETSNYRGFLLFQAILASSFAEKDFQKAKAAGVRVLQVLFNKFGFRLLILCNTSKQVILIKFFVMQMGLVLGFGLAIVVAIGLYFGSGVFSKDKNVIRFIIIAIPVQFNKHYFRFF